VAQILLLNATAADDEAMLDEAIALIESGFGE